MARSSVVRSRAALLRFIGQQRAGRGVNRSSPDHLRHSGITQLAQARASRQLQEDLAQRREHSHDFDDDSRNAAWTLVERIEEMMFSGGALNLRRLGGSAADM